MSSQPKTTPPSLSRPVDPDTCRHPRVRIVSRDEDAEYVECEECRSVFESTEFRDMSIEDTLKQEEE